MPGAQAIRVARARALSNRRAKIDRILDYTNRRVVGEYLGQSHVFYSGDDPPEDVLDGVNPGIPELPNLCVLPIIRSVTPDLFIAVPGDEITFAVTYDQPDPTDAVTMHVDGSPALKLAEISRTPIVVGGLTIGFSFTFDLTAALIPAFYTLSIAREAIPECRDVAARVVKLELDCIVPTITDVSPDSIFPQPPFPPSSTLITITYDDPLPDDIIGFLPSGGGAPPSFGTTHLPGVGVEILVSLGGASPGDYDIVIARAADPSGCNYTLLSGFTIEVCPIVITSTAFGPPVPSGSSGHSASIFGSGFLSGPIDVRLFRTGFIDIPPFFVLTFLSAPSVITVIDDTQIDITWDATLPATGPSEPTTAAPPGAYNVAVYRTDAPPGTPPFTPPPITTCNDIEPGVAIVT